MYSGGPTKIKLPALLKMSWSLAPTAMTATNGYFCGWLMLACAMFLIAETLYGTPGVYVPSKLKEKIDMPPVQVVRVAVGLPKVASRSAMDKGASCQPR